MKNLTESVRPVLTYFGFFVFIIVMSYGVITHQFEWAIYISQVGGLVGIMIGFWYGERSALKNPKE